MNETSSWSLTITRIYKINKKIYTINVVDKLSKINQSCQSQAFRRTY